MITVKLQIARRGERWICRRRRVKRKQNNRDANNQHVLAAPRCFLKGTADTWEMENHLVDAKRGYKCRVNARKCRLEPGFQIHLLNPLIWDAAGTPFHQRRLSFLEATEERILKLTHPTVTVNVMYWLCGKEEKKEKNQQLSNLTGMMCFCRNLMFSTKKNRRGKWAPATRDLWVEHLKTLCTFLRLSGQTPRSGGRQPCDAWQGSRALC